MGPDNEVEYLAQPLAYSRRIFSQVREHRSKDEYNWQRTRSLVADGCIQRAIVKAAYLLLRTAIH